jgi:hypothetical protein
MDPIDFRFKKLEEIFDWHEAHAVTIHTEADTRMKLITRILTEGLGWQFEDLMTEERAGGGILDYKLSIQGCARIIVEAKKADIDFGLSGRLGGQAFKLSGPVFNVASKEAVRQVIEYCAFKSAELACATNGVEWVIFRANRLGDGRETLDGKGFVFGSLKDIKDNFARFHDLLSPESNSSLRFRGLFQEAEGIPLRDLSFYRAFRPADSKRLLARGEFATDFDDIMNAFFQRLKGDDDPDMVVDCFVITPESERAEQLLTRVADDLVLKLREINTGTGEQLLEIIEMVRRQNKTRFALLVGSKGAGKSTFIDRFFRFVLPKDTADALVIIKLDLSKSSGSETEITSWLDRNLLDECEKALYGSEDKTWNDAVGDIFFDEYQRWSNMTMKPLYESNREQFRVEFGRHIEDIRRTRPHDYIKRLLKHITKSRKKIPCLILDNTDHHSILYQEKVFQYARSIYESELCMVLIPITDKTSWQLSRQGALQSFESEVLHLPVPKPHRVIERRIEYLSKKLRLENHQQTKDYFFGKSIRLDIQNLSAFIANLNQIFVESKNTSEWIGGLANYDIRRVLQLTREMIASPHLPLEELLKAHLIGRVEVVPQWKIKQAIIKRGYDIYPVGEHPFVQNIYSLDVDVPTTPLLGLRVLQYLRDADKNVGVEDRPFISVESVYEHMGSLGIEK